ncbi:MAG: alpha/beta hydrolase [Cellulomonadaceae bacterium]|nr:alpha/beta hydrolase [Cellulomonadaceae bacterium]
MTPDGAVPPARVVDGVEERLDAVVSALPGYRELTVDVFRAADRHGEVLPLVVWIHGGGWEVGSPKHDWPFLTAAGSRSRIMGAGFALAMVTYRFSSEATFPAQIDDVKAALRWLHRNADEIGVDRRAFAVWGESAGGHLAALAALTSVAASGWQDAGREDETVAAAVVWYAPSDFQTLQGQTPDGAIEDSAVPHLLGGPVEEVREVAIAASPVTWVSRDAPPMLLVHGTEDLLVPCEQSRRLADALREVGADVRLQLVPGADHGFDGVDVVPIIDEGIAFLRALVQAPT